MAFPTITLTNLASNQLAVDAKFTQDRALRRTLAVGESFVLPNGVATLDELDINEQIQQLVADGDLGVAVGNGPTATFRYTVAADAGTSADTVTLEASFPFQLALSAILVVVGTGVATSTITLASAASGGVDYSDAVDTATSGANAAGVLQANNVIPKGGLLVGNRSATAKPDLTIIVSGIRQTL